MSLTAESGASDRRTAVGRHISRGYPCRRVSRTPGPHFSCVADGYCGRPRRRSKDVVCICPHAVDHQKRHSTSPEGTECQMGDVPRIDVTRGSVPSVPTIASSACQRSVVNRATNERRQAPSVLRVERARYWRQAICCGPETGSASESEYSTDWYAFGDGRTLCGTARVGQRRDRIGFSIGRRSCKPRRAQVGIPKELSGRSSRSRAWSGFLPRRRHIPRSCSRCRASGTC